MDYSVIRSRRRTVGFEIKENGLIVRAPAGMTDGEIEEFVSRHMNWIRKNLLKSELARKKRENTPKLTNEEIEELSKSKWIKKIRM